MLIHSYEISERTEGLGSVTDLGFRSLSKTPTH